MASIEVIIRDARGNIISCVKPYKLELGQRLLSDQAEKVLSALAKLAAGSEWIAITSSRLSRHKGMLTCYLPRGNHSIF